MKINRILIILFVMFFSALVGSQLCAEVKVTWHGYNTGIQKAKQTGRPIVIDFYASWCYWCKVMDRETFSNDIVGRKLNADYVAIRIDMESNEQIKMKTRTFSPKEFAAMLGVRGLPSVAFMDKNGEIITVIPGYVKVDTFMPLLGYIKDECYKNSVSFKDYVEQGKGCGKKK